MYPAFTVTKKVGPEQTVVLNTPAQKLRVPFHNTHRSGYHLWYVNAIEYSNLALTVRSSHFSSCFPPLIVDALILDSPGLGHFDSPVEVGKRFFEDEKGVLGLKIFPKWIFDGPMSIARKGSAMI